MNVSLTPKLEKWVQLKVASGLYGSSSEVVRDALRLLYYYDSEKIEKLEALKTELRLGVEQLRNGKSEPLTKSVSNRIKKTGKKEDTWLKGH